IRGSYQIECLLLKFHILYLINGVSPHHYQANKIPHAHQLKKTNPPQNEKMSFLVIKNKSVILGDSFSMAI
ncbi:hypothetical protein COL60_23220, partial [Bacillus pseudomycoides]